MSDLSNEVPFRKEPVNDENPTPSRVVLFTLLLLIAGLLMTGTMMLYYANVHRGDLAKTTSESETPPQTDTPASSFFAKIGAKNNAADSGTTKTNTNTGIMDQLFGGRNSSSANWPKLKLTGFGTATDESGGFAIINHHQYRQGDLINGKVKLLEIRRYDVLMEYKGETNTLSLYSND